MKELSEPTNQITKIINKIDTLSEDFWIWICIGFGVLFLDTQYLRS